MKKFFLFLFICAIFILTPSFSLTQEVITLENPIQDKFATDDPAVLIGYVIKTLLGVVGGVSLLVMVYGGFQWLTAAGNEDKIKKGTQTMLWSAIGLILVFSSYLLVDTIFGFFTPR